MLLLATAVGCTKPRLDTSSADQFATSLVAVKAKLPKDARAELDAALATLAEAYPASAGARASASDGRAGQPRPPLSRALREKLQGKTGREVIALAAEWTQQQAARRQRAEALARERQRRAALRELRELRAELDTARPAALERVAVTRARLVWPETNGDDDERRETAAVKAWFTPTDAVEPEPEPDPSSIPAIELGLESQLRNGIYAILFEVQLLTTERTEPWLAFRTKQRFSRGLFFGQSATRRFVPDELTQAFGAGAAQRPPAPGALVLLVRPIRLYGPAGQAVARIDISSDALARIGELIETLTLTGAAPDSAPTATRPAADAELAAKVAAIAGWRERTLARAYTAKAKALRAERLAAERARAPFARFQIEQARFYWSDNPIHRKPIIELRVRNETGQAIRRCHCRGTLSSPERDEPWVDDRFTHEMHDALAPGEARTLRVVPNWLGPWGRGPKDRDDLQLTVTLDQLDGPRQRALFADRFGADKVERLRALEALIAERGW
jgi:hypothetical protein